MENRGYGRVYTYRKEDGMGYGVYDPEKVFFILDPEGKVYINDRRCTIIKKGDLPPCEAMTLRFKFSDPTYDPVVAGVGTGGTWKQVTFSPNIWDWNNPSNDWSSCFEGQFTNASNLVEIVDYGDTRSVTILYRFLRGCVSLVKTCLFDTQNVTNFHGMFSGCNKIEHSPLFNTGNATTMRGMFYNCLKLQDIPLFDTKNIERFEEVFASCISLKEIPLFNLVNAKYLSNTFDGCYAIEYGALDLYNYLITKPIVPLYYNACFRNCGRDTPTGLAELQQIPSSWGGFGA